MSLSRYKNTIDVINATNPISAKFFTNSQIKLLSPTVIYPKLDNEKFLSNGSVYSKQKVEFHVYSLDGAYLSGTQFSSNYQAIGDEDIYFDVQQDLNELGILSGNYKFVYNVLLDHVGSFATEKLFLYNISNSRTELILKLENPDSQDSIKELESFFRYWISQTKYFINAYLNFSGNNLIQIANIASDATQNTIYIKLFEALPPQFTTQTVCWISELLSSPYIDNIQIIPTTTARTSTTLQPPQFDVEKLYWKHFDSEYKNWTELTSTNSEINELVTTNIFRRKFGIKLNIDFSDLKNFIFYSSVEERILNFIYKVELIAWYQEQIDTILELNALYSSDVLNYANAKRSILNSFDDFEVFLYYGKNISTYEGSSYKIPPVPKVEVISGPTPITWIQWAQTWINAVVVWKNVVGSTTKFITIDTKSPEFIAWKENAISVSKEFDFENEAQLIKTIPDFIRDNENNSQYLLFVNMIAQYFDTIWLYIKQFNEKYSQYEHPDLGISKDLASSIIKDLGWAINESDKIKDLWFYMFGLTEDAKLTRTNLSNNEYALSGKDYTKSIWKRILLNLPNINKTKGTYRSISALLSAYGIPSSKFFIREFGGPSDKNTRPKYKQEKSVSYVMIESGSQVTMPYVQYEDYSNQLTFPNSLYFRFIPDKESFSSNPTIILNKNDKIKVLFEKDELSDFNGNIKLEISSSIGVSSASIQNVEYIEEIPTSIFLQTGNPVSSSTQIDTLNLFVLQKKYDKVSFIESCSINLSGSLTEAFISTGSINLFGNNSKYYLHEFRYWKHPLDIKIMESHMLSPLSYHGDSVKDSTEELLGRYVFWLYNAYDTSDVFPKTYPINIVNLNTSSIYTASLNFSLYATSSFVYYDEYVKYEIPTIGDNGILPEKERIENNSIVSNLSIDNRAESIAYLQQELDYNKLKIGFSPQFNINEDIYNRFGTFRLDDYIGSTLENNSKYYKELYNLSEFYYKNSKTTNHIHDYLKALRIFDFSIFEQIRQVIPAKANSIMGIIVENNELQRIKLKQLPILSTDIQESERIELVRSALRTVTFNQLNATTENLNDIEIVLDTTPSGNIIKRPDITEKFSIFSDIIRKKTNVISSINSIPNYNSTIRITGLFGNYVEDETRRLITYTQQIPYTYITASYFEPVYFIQRGYETYNFGNYKTLPYIIDAAENKNGYYGTLEYTYDNDASASVQRFSSAKIKFGKNSNFIKRVHKGAENHRYAGCKIVASSINTITTSSPSVNNVFSVFDIPSGSTDIMLSSSFANDSFVVVENPYVNPPLI